ncbi:MAG: Ig-like domain-containing protein [bacterium]
MKKYIKPLITLAILMGVFFNGYVICEALGPPDETPPVTTLSLDGISFEADDVIYTNLNTKYVLNATDVGLGVDYTQYRIDQGAWEVYTSSVTFVTSGIHVLDYMSVDRAGNEEQIKSATYHVDSKAPQAVLSIEGPQFNDGGLTYITSASTITFTSTDTADNGVASGVSSVKYRIDSSDWVISAGSAVDITPAGLSAGIHQLEYLSTDNVNNEEGSQTFDFYLDDSAPETNIVLTGTQTEIDGKIYITPQTEITLDATDGGDNPTGVDYTQYRIDQGPWVVYTSSISFPVSGIHVLDYMSVDKVGNEGEIKSVTYHVDSKAPQTDLVIDGGTAFTRDDITYINAGSIRLTSTDEEDNGVASGVNSIKYKIDDSDWVTSQASTVEISIASLSEGIHQLVYLSTDNVGNEEESQTFDFYLDDSAPETNIVLTGTQTEIDGKTYITPQTEITLDSSDQGSSVQQILYSIDSGAYAVYTSTLTISNEGEHEIGYYGIDNIGNQEVPKTATVYVDTTAPETLMLVDESSNIAEFEGKKYISHRSAITFSAEDPLIVNGLPSGVKETSYRINDGAWAVFSTGFGINDEGENNISYFSEDNMGNIETVNADTVCVDKTAPLSSLTVEGIQLIEGDVTYISTQSTFTITATDVLSGGVASGVQTISYRIDDGQWANIHAPSYGTSSSAHTLTFDINDGQHTIEYKSTDRVGNAEEKSYSAFFDGTRPEVSNTSPADGGFVKHDEINALSVTFSEPVSSANGWKNDIRVEETESGELAQYDISYDSVTYTANISGYLKNSRQYTVIAKSGIRDKVGNSLEEDSFSFRTLMDASKGGTIYDEVTGILIEVPPDSLPCDGYFDIRIVTLDESLEQQPKPKFWLLGTDKAYQIIFYNANGEVVTEKTSKPFKVTFSLDHELLQTDDEEVSLWTIELYQIYGTQGTLLVSYGRASANNKAKQDKSINLIDRTLTVEMSGFGYFNLAGFRAPDDSLQDLCSYPNPFEAGKQSSTIQYYLEEDSSVDIAIYDLVGNLVRTFEFAEGDAGAATGMNTVSWDGKNGVGDLVANGGYILQAIMEKGGSKVAKRWKILVIE